MSHSEPKHRHAIPNLDAGGSGMGATAIWIGHRPGSAVMKVNAETSKHRHQHQGMTFSLLLLGLPRQVPPPAPGVLSGSHRGCPANRAQPNPQAPGPRTTCPMQSADPAGPALANLPRSAEWRWKPMEVTRGCGAEPRTGGHVPAVLDRPWW